MNRRCEPCFARQAPHFYAISRQSSSDAITLVHIWIVEPELAFLQVWVLRNGRYEQRAVCAAGETFTSPALTAELTLDAIFPAADA